MVRENVLSALLLIVLIGIGRITPVFGETTQVYRLSHTSASEAADKLRESLSDLRPQPQITVDQEKNLLTVTGTEEALRWVSNLVKKIDLERRQILIEAMLVELASSEMDKLGIELREPKVPKKDTALPAVGAPKLARIDSEKYAELKKKLKSLDAAKSEKIRILSTPRLIASDKQQAALSIGEGVHYMEKVEGGLYRLKTLDSENGPGLFFNVTPTIGDNGIDIILALDFRLARIVKRVAIPEAPELQVGMPIIDLQQMTASVVVKNGEAAVLGGLARRDSKGQELNTLFFVAPHILP